METINMHTLNGWEYPYKVWPEDFPYEGIFSETFISEQISKNSFPDNEEFKALLLKALENAAKLYYGEIYFRGKGSLSYKDMQRKISKLAEMTNTISNQLKNLPIELFEELVEATSPRDFNAIENDPYEIQDISHYRQCRINSHLGHPMPSIQQFYKDHEGIALFCELKERLE